MASLKAGNNGVSKNGQIMDVDIMVQNTLKKLALKKKNSNEALTEKSGEVMRSKTSIQDFKKKFAPQDNTYSNVSTVSSQPRSPSPVSLSPSAESVISKSIQNDSPLSSHTATVDVIVTNTLKKLEKKKSSVTNPVVDSDHDKEGAVIRSKTSVAEFRTRFSSSSYEHGKEGWNSLETTPIRNKNAYTHPMIEKDVILVDDDDGKSSKSISDSAPDRENL